MMNAGDGDSHQHLKGSQRILTRHSIIHGTYSAYKQGLIQADAQSDKLNLQFRYFRETFIGLAAASSVPVPLGVTEDPHARLFTFCRHDGPKYVLDTLATHKENVPLTRCGLSLLIMTITILSNKLLPEAETIPALSSSPDVKFAQAPLYQLQAKEKRKGLTESEWAAKLLHHLCETGAVSAIINLLTSTAVQGVQEQCVNLLALLVTVSEDAAQHMLAPPNSSLLIGAGDGGDKPPSTEAAGHSPGPSASPHARPSSRGAGKASYRAPTMLETTLRNASASTQSFPMLAKRLGIHVDLEGSEGGGHSRKKTVPSGGPGRSAAGQARAASCLSHLLTVVAQNKNAHVLIAGCAECVANMCLRVADLTAADELHPLHPIHHTPAQDAQSRHLFGASSGRAPAATAMERFDAELCLIVAQTRTTTLLHGAAGSNEKKSKPGFKEGTDKDGGSHKDGGKDGDGQSGPVVCWACLRIFFRFLARNFRYRGEHSTEQGGGQHEDAGDGSGDAEADDRAGPARRASRMSDQQRDSYRYAFDKVMLALSRMVLGSDVVCRQVLALRGAEELLRQSARGIVEPVLRSLASRAVERLRAEKRALRRERGGTGAHGGAGAGLRGQSRASQRAEASYGTQPAGGAATTETQGMQATTVSQAMSSPSLQGGMGPRGSMGAGMGAMGYPSNEGQSHLHQDQSIGLGLGEGSVTRGDGSAWPAPLSYPGDYHDETGAPRVRTAGTRTRPSGTSSGTRRPITPLGRPFTAPLPTSPVVLYHMPESPVRRGLSPKHRSRDDDTSLHKAVFGNLPYKPVMPHRIAPDEAVAAVELLPSSEQSAGRKVLKAATQKAVGTLEWEGYMQNGKHSVPILERARRAYLPKPAAPSPQAPSPSPGPAMPADEEENEEAEGGSPEGTDTPSAPLGRAGKRQPKAASIQLPPPSALAGREEDPYTFRSYTSLGLATEISFDGPELLQSFRPIYEIDLGPLASMSLSEEGFPVSALQNPDLPPPDRKARHGLLTNADLLFSM